MNLPYILILSKDAQAVSIIRHRKDIPRNNQRKKAIYNRGAYAS